MAQHTGDAQFLRKFYDTLYKINLDNAVAVYKNTPRQVRWLALSAVGIVILTVVLIQLAAVGVEAVQWANRTPLEQRLAPPYGLEMKIVPALDTARYPEHGVPIIEMAAYEEARRAIAAEMSAEITETTTAPLQEEAPAPSNGLLGRFTAAVDTALEEAEAAAEPVEVEVPEALILAEILPDFDESYFVAMPLLAGYTRSFIHDTPVHPSLNCLISVDEESNTGCGMTYPTVFMEAADYIHEETGNSARVIMAQYENVEQAQTAVSELLLHGARAGILGNYAIRTSQPVGYYFSSANGWINFTWIHDQWVYMASVKSLADLDALIPAFPF